MRKFVDLHLRPSIRNLDHLEQMIQRSSDLGYHLVGISLPPNIKQDEIRKLKTISEDVGADLVTRVDLVPKSSRELLRNLRDLRRKFEIISVNCNSKDVARQAAKDRRVDILAFSTGFSRKPYFDKAEGELASKMGVAIEIDLTSLFLLTGFPRVRFLTGLRKEVAIAEKFKVPIVVSSGATNVGLLRGPYDCVALGMLFDLPMSVALRGLSENPLRIIDRNRKKLSAGYVAPGLFVMRDVKRCVNV